LADFTDAHLPFVTPFVFYSFTQEEMKAESREGNKEDRITWKRRGGNRKWERSPSYFTI